MSVLYFRLPICRKQQVWITGAQLGILLDCVGIEWEERRYGAVRLSKYDVSEGDLHVNIDVDMCLIETGQIQHREYVQMWVSWLPSEDSVVNAL